MNGKDFFNIIGMIDDDLIMEANKEVKTVKHSKIKITVIAAAIAVVAAAIGAAGHYAVGSISIHSSNIPDYRQIPDAQTQKKDLGFEAEIIEEFSNGYKFKNASIANDVSYDTQGNAAEEFKSLVCRYEKGGDDINLFTDASQVIDGEGKAPTGEYNGVSLYYYSYANKLVPGNYELTEQDKKDQEEGKYVFSFGSPEGIEIVQVQGLNFRCGEINYSFCAIDSPLTEEALEQMAAEIIDAAEK